MWHCFSAQPGQRILSLSLIPRPPTPLVGLTAECPQSLRTKLTALLPCLTPVAIVTRPLAGSTGAGGGIAQATTSAMQINMVVSQIQVQNR
ncbi:hypothetical protein HMN09_01139300 [Mycena chlorophos]|uniref:Uncharacterized protein n=1 Tax=Mycena chlorophos TaxID=658473 RepID=A0A8H6S6R1_MYCCL|nr:hypothetical protein HMN09_01139300 [Mycena chlorophos]